jgi:pyruvate/2-oxoacid:ferredoxin oxidoreductase alpha subunit
VTSTPYQHIENRKRRKIDMSPERKSQPAAPKTPPAAGPAAGTETAQGTSTRKPWVKKTPVEVVLDQIAKQEEKVNDMREELKKEERELQKLQQAKKVLEAT